MSELHGNSGENKEAGPKAWTAVEKTLLSSGVIHLCQVALDLPGERVAGLLPLLSLDEIERANRFYFARDRVRFIVAHAALRQMLAQYTKANPRDLRFDYNAFGKPSLAYPRPWTSFDFNLSHSENVAVFAFALDRRVGVDVEFVRDDLPLDEVAGGLLSSTEKVALSTLPPEKRMRAFYRCWCRREAYLKAQGIGLDLPLDALVVFSERGLAMFDQEHADGDEVDGWSFDEPRLDPAYVCACVSEGARPRVSRFFCPPNALFEPPRG